MKISIITASYNYAQYIEEAINSVINQSYQDWELIVVDDGSSDNSVEIIKSYCDKDERIKFFEHEKSQNKGLKETILLGLKNATGNWVAFLESDDVWAPDNLLKKIEAIEKNPSVKLIFNKVEFIGEVENNPKIKIFEKTQNDLAKMNFPKNMFKDFYQKNMILTFSAVSVNKNILLNTLQTNPPPQPSPLKGGGSKHSQPFNLSTLQPKNPPIPNFLINLNTPIEAFLDWWLWIHLAYKNDFYYIDEPLTKWRLHKKSYIKTSKLPKLPVFQACAYFDVFKNTKDLNILPFIFFSQAKLYLNKAMNLVSPFNRP